MHIVLDSSTVYGVAVMAKLRVGQLSNDLAPSPTATASTAESPQSTRSITPEKIHHGIKCFDEKDAEADSGRYDQHIGGR